MGMKDRFHDRDQVIAALKEQAVVLGDQDIASAIADQGELASFAPGQILIEQGKSDRDIYFLLSGETRILINKVRMHCRGPGVTVGEMSAINAKVPRSATIEAEGEIVAWKLGHEQLANIAENHPILWRRLAVDLAGRLEQRNHYVNRANLKPKIFIMCSAEALPIAKAIRVGLRFVSDDIELWSDDQLFETGNYPLVDLERIVGECDFAIALAEPDDIVRSRDRREKTVRDNVIFELGFFMSRLGRGRTMLLVPKGEDVKLPSDFKGLSPIEYNKRDETKLPVTLGPAIDQIEARIKKAGVRSSLVEIS